MFLLVPILFFCSILQSSVATVDYVQNLAAIAINSTALNITWSGPIQAGVMSYNLTVSSTQQVFETITIDTNIGISPNYIDQEIVFGGLSPFTEYTIVVGGDMNVLLTPETVMQTTLQATPGAPELTSVNVINPSTIRVSWHAPLESEQNGPITSFIIDFSNSIIPTPYNQTEDTTLPYPISVTIGFATNFIVEEGITYSVSVRAVNDAGVGLASESITVTTPVVAPPQTVPFIQSELTNVTLNPTSISFLVPILTIPFLNGPLIGYNITYIGTLFGAKVFQTLMTSLQIDQTASQMVFVPAGNNITVINLLPNYVYLLSTSASNSEGTTNTAALTFLLPPDSPGAPINVTLLVVSYQQINVSWSIDLTTVNGLLLYFNIYYYTTAGYSNVAVYNATDVTSVGPYTMSLTGLSPNTLYSITVTIVNEVSEGSHSSVVEAETHPAAPDNNLITTVSPTQITSNTIQIYVPTQQLFTTADIAVIYIIADSSSPPLFSSYTPNQRYNSVFLASSAVIDVAATVRIQALLDASYYNQLTDYVRFSVGDGGTFLFNGLAVDNIPLRSDTEYQISYYILFYNADGLLSPEFAYYRSLTATDTDLRDNCLACFLIPICAFVAILVIIVLVVALVLGYILWDKRYEKLTPPSTQVSPKREILKAQDSLILVNQSAEATPTDSGVKDTIV